MTRARLVAALLCGVACVHGAAARGADAVQNVSTRGRALLVTPAPGGMPARWRISPAPRPAPAATAPVAPAVPADQDFNTCRKSPAKNGLVKVTLKPDTNIDDLVVWISSITCRQFVWSEAIAARNKKVTIVAPLPMTPRQAFGLFLNALDSVGLTVEKTRTFWRIIETHKIKSTPVPLYGFDGQRLPG
jgi:hypothetical protein